MTEPVNLELAQLARLDFDDADGGGALPPGGAEAGATGEPGTAALDAAVSALALGILRTMRTLIARRLPEIKDEWTDDVLRAPADALPPVMRRYAGQVSEWAARFPELVALGVSAMPMAMGYMAAVERHARTVEDVQPKPAPAAPAPAAPAQGSNGGGGPAVFHVG